MTTPMKFTLTIACAIVLSSVLAGCGSAGEPVPEPDASAVSTSQAMTGEARDALPEGFPIEVPVIDGTVLRGSTDDTDLGPWFYALECDDDRDAVAGWYRQAYTGRSWQVVDEASGDAEHVFVLEKGEGAWSTVRISTTETGSRVDCWTGIGVSMPPEALPPAEPPASEV